MYCGFNSSKPLSRLNSNYSKRPFPIDKLLKILFAISLVLSLPKFMIFTGYYANIFNKVIHSVTLFVSGGADVLYASRQELTNAVGIWKYVNYVSILLGPLYWAYMPLSICYWKRLSAFLKLGTLFIWIMYLLQYICTGTNVGIFEFFITFFIAKIIYNIKNNTTSKKPIGKKNIVIIVALVVILLYSFDFIMSARIGDNVDALLLGNTTAFFNSDSFIWCITPDVFKSVLLYIVRYMCVPYHALACAFDISFTPTFGVGYSWFLLDQIPLELWDNTYMMKMETTMNYSHWTNWHTAYMWFANDVSFLGVPFVLFFLFKLFGKAWSEFLRTGNICSFLQFVLFVKFVTYISMNNQVFQGSDCFLAFWLLLILSKSSKKYSWC